MVEASNTMIVTNKGLSTISGILINNYIYNGDITIIGNPNISNSGVASQLGVTSYFERDNLELLGVATNTQEETELHTVSIDFTGTFTPSETYSTAFSLTGEKTLSAFLNSTSLVINYNGNDVLVLSGFSLGASNPVHITVNINPNFINAS